MLANILIKIGIISACLIIIGGTTYVANMHERSRYSEGHVLRWDSDRDFSCASFTVYVRNESLYDGKFVLEGRSSRYTLGRSYHSDRYCEYEVKNDYSRWEFRVLSPNGTDLNSDTVLAVLARR